MKIKPFKPCLGEKPVLSAKESARIEKDYLNSPFQNSSTDHEKQILDTYGIDLSSRYGPIPIKNPWGKASGQLSMNFNQVQDDVDAGLGFVVLKTVIAEDDSGSQSMSDWAIPEARMKVEPITAQSGEKGWTVSWKGRGWSLTFQDYLDFFQQTLEASQEKNMLVIPSCKYHLPVSGEETWNRKEYQYTTGKLLDVWNQSSACNDYSMPLEKDFSPTLAGSDRAKARESILDWLDLVPEYIYESAMDHQAKNRSGFKADRYPVTLGLKIFNAMFDDDFQTEMLNRIHQNRKFHPDFFIYGNRLFDPERQFEDHTGIAYGGPDLSNRNINIMDQFLNQNEKPEPVLPWSATGNIQSGRMAIEYALRGAESFQIHTYFQLPNNEYSLKQGSRTAKALHELYFHPQEGLIAWLLDLSKRLGISQAPIRFQDFIGKRDPVRQAMT